jgi:hypothetical protein
MIYPSGGMDTSFRPRNRPARRWTTRLRSLVLAIPVLGSGCDRNESDGGHAQGEHGATTVDPSDDPRVDDFMPGLTKEGDAVRLTLIEAVPSELVRGDNAWTLRVSDPSGEPLDDFTIEVQPWMPDHGHGTGVPAEITHLGDGEVHFDPLRLYMNGLWEVRFTITFADGASETLVIGVWVP